MKDLNDGVEAKITYQKFCASLSALNKMHTVHFHMPELHSLNMIPSSLHAA
jgi:hypothetical protein